MLQTPARAAAAIASLYLRRCARGRMILAKARIQGHTARKRFGQHFLIDSAVIDAIVSAIAPAPQDCLVEIGPGLGALTWPLLERLGGAGRLHAIEMDRDLAAHLQRLAMLRSSSMRAMRCALISLSLRARNRRGCGLWAICLTTSPVRCYFICLMR